MSKYITVNGDIHVYKHSRKGRKAAQAYFDWVIFYTRCVECGAQPVEFHNEEHHKNPNRRLGNMVSSGKTKEEIDEEIKKCIPLCRKCHMEKDGRLDKLRTKKF